MPHIEDTAQRIACIGRRDISPAERLYIESIGAHYGSLGYLVCSGNAPGADQAYQMGALTEGGADKIEVYLPWPGFERRALIGDEVVYVARDVTREQAVAAAGAHPRWDRLPATIRPLLLRNAMLVWNAALVVAFPDLSKPGWGGAGHAIRVAQGLGKPVWIALPGQQRFL